MINPEYIIKFCKEDPNLIENYDKAIADKSQTWDCHHRLEVDENKSAKQLIDEGRYFNRPASELIFLTHSEHQRLHNTGKHQSEESNRKRSESMTGENHPSYGKPRSKETKRRLSKSRKEWLKHNKHQLKDKRCINNGIHNRFIDPSEFDKYEAQGYHWGYISNKNKIK